MTEQARERINQITITNLRPASERVQSRTRFGTASDTLQLAQLWPKYWAVDRAAFRKSVNTFLIAVGSSRQSSSQERQTDQSSNLSTPPSDLDPDAGVSLRPLDKGHPQEPLSTARDTITGRTLASKSTSAPLGTLPNMAGEGSSDQPISGFSELQHNELVNIVSAVIQRHHRNHVQDQLQRDPGPGNNPRPEAAPVLVTKELNSEEVGCFDPDYKGCSAVVNAGKNGFYRDVYAFVDCLKDMEQIKGEEKLRTVVPQCFRGSALIWHSIELSETEKALLRRADLVAWYKTLIARFKQRTPLVLKSLQKSRYTMANAKEKKDPRQFVQDIVRHARAAQIDSVYNQLSTAWQNLDWQF